VNYDDNDDSNNNNNNTRKLTMTLIILTSAGIEPKDFESSLVRFHCVKNYTSIHDIHTHTHK